jgi:hypothetical protein
VNSARNTRFTFFPSLAPAAIASLLALALLLAPDPAEAQVHWDANVQAGGAGRFFSNSVSGGLPGSIAPVIGLEAAVAIVPLLRLGVYADFEYADTSEPAFSSVVSFGGRVKLMIPGNRNHVHWWLFTGFGGVVWNAPSYTIADQTSQGTSGLANAATATAATGEFFEIPVGVGMGIRLRRPWEVVFELQGRFGLDMNGSYFTQNGGFTDPDNSSGIGTTRPTNSTAGAGAVPTGNDVFGLLLTVGIGFDD